jgi:hypothetical protein
MTDPVSLTAIATTTIFLTKGIEKISENIFQEAWQRGKEFLLRLRQKAPEIAEAIEKVSEYPALAEDEPEQYGIAILINQVEEVAAENLEIEQAARSVVEALNLAPVTIFNTSKLAEKIGLVVQKGTVNIDKFTF